MASLTGRRSVHNSSWRRQLIRPSTDHAHGEMEAAHAIGLRLSRLWGSGDPEYADVPGQRLQARLCVVADSALLEDIAARLQGSQQWSELRLIEDLRDPGNDHSWLWALHPARGLPPDEFVTAVRLRLGARITDEPAVCIQCGVDMGCDCRHALCCARGAGNRGHDKVRDTTHSFAELADPSACIEPLGLVPSAPTLRPADVFTSAAIPGRMAALDVGVACPDAAAATDDACDAMQRRKLDEHAPYLAELADEGVVYRPLVFSCWGRPHPEALELLAALAAAAARRQGFADGASLLRCARRAISVQLWRRAASMVHACLPRPSADEAAAALAGGV